MERLEKPWHIRHGNISRAYVKAPASLRLKLILWSRGWRRWHFGWWSKLSRPSWVNSSWL